MTFKKYNSSNNAICSLYLDISNSSMTMRGVGNFNRFSTSNFIVRVTQYTDGVVTARENMYITSRSGDTFVIGSRAIEAVPISDSATSNIIQALPFTAGAVIEQVASMLFMTDIQDEVTRLESDKLNKGGLRTSLANAWKMFFSNGSKNETELAFGASGTYLMSNGTSANPSWSNPPLDINGQTTSTSPATSWYVALYNGTANVKTTLTNLVKGLGYATKTLQGVLRFATDAEATAGTIDTVAITAKQAKDNYGVNSFGMNELTSPAGSFSSIQYGSSLQVLSNAVISVKVGGTTTSTNRNVHGVQYSPDNSTWTTLRERDLSGVIPTDNLVVRVPTGYYIRAYQGGTSSTAADIQVKLRWQN